MSYLRISQGGTKMLGAKNFFLKTGLSQIDTTKKLIENLQKPIEELLYNIKRYKIPVSLVLFYTEEDISQALDKHIRLTDVLRTIKIGDSYFNFVFLPFTEVENSYSFLKETERKLLQNTEYLFHIEEVEPAVNNFYNFINSFLFEILEREKEKHIGY